jgi:hypothetical protein
LEDREYHQRRHFEKQACRLRKPIVSALSAQLAERFGRNFELRNLRRMMQFAEQFPDAEIVSASSTQLSLPPQGDPRRKGLTPGTAAEMAQG